ncbi:MAG: YchF/TatD family DNA exonuclease [Deltaproteobacteria bacterium]|nr:YchF/TatD family DNA exonuclease [Deltaproteobacteria bacterium]
MSELTFIDTHAHLDDRAFKDDVEGVVARAREAGIKKIITVGCWSKKQGVKQVVEIAEKEYEGVTVYAALGIHPHDASDVKSDTPYNEIRTLCENSKKVVAIGECGLDYHYNNSPKKEQRKVFIDQINLARELTLPLVIHTREAEDETIEIMRGEGAEEIGGVLHCFSGSEKLATEGLKMGFMLSFSGIITFPKADELRDVLRNVPTERLLIETDAPYLAPKPYRGKTNESAYVVETAKKMAEVKALTIEDISRITTLNAESVFSLNEVEERGEKKAEIAYKIRNSLYLNITNRCSNACTFCAKFKSYEVKGHYLKLGHEPNFNEVLKAVEALGENPASYDEIVFCGFGESLIRLELLKKIGTHFKEMGCRIRIDTDGLANLFHQRNILSELIFVDEVSVSLNAPDAATYEKLCRTPFGLDAFPAILFFLREAKKFISRVQATVVSVPNLDIEACRRIAEDDIGVAFRVRTYNEVG